MKPQPKPAVLEVSLVFVVLGLSVLMDRIVESKLVILNLYFLPVLLAAFFLGRYQAGVLALLSVSMVTIVATQDLVHLSTPQSPLVSALVITVWAAILGLTSIFAGTLSDERGNHLRSLHASYLGSIEVFSKFLHSSNPAATERSKRISHLATQVAEELGLSAQEVENIHVAAWLREMDNLEVTSKVVRKGMANPDAANLKPSEGTFHGGDLVQAVGSVIPGAMLLMAPSNEAGSVDGVRHVDPESMPLGALVLQLVSTYDSLTHRVGDGTQDSQRAIIQLRAGTHGNHSRSVLNALAKVLPNSSVSAPANGTATGSPAVSTIPA